MISWQVIVNVIVSHPYILAGNARVQFDHSFTRKQKYRQFTDRISCVGGKMAGKSASTGRLRSILGGMEFGRRNLTADGPVI